MKRVLLLAILLFGCQEQQASLRYHAVGYVRSIWCGRDICSVVFEGEDKSIFTIQLLEVPPVWQGLHAEIEYEINAEYGQRFYKNLRVVRRLD